MNLIRNLLISIGLLVASLGAYAEPTSSPMNIAYTRPWQGNVALFATTAPGGTFCTVSQYSIDLSTVAGRAQFAVVQGALMNGTQVKLEIPNAGCPAGPVAGWNAIYSVYGMP